MKNIHVMPTDKPSKLLFDKEEMHYLPLQDEPVFMEYQNLVENQNIYITNDEETKTGDLCMDIITKYIYRATRTIPKRYNKSQQKIILTTDPDLIKDGVQSIDDEFLEWFVKNPTCEMVNIIIEYKDGYGNWFKYDKEFWDKQGNKPKFGTRYKIIIPKQETPEQHLELINNNIEEFDKAIELFRQRKSKQETLEEFAYKYAEMYRCPATNENEYCKHDIISAVNNGAKWQQQQNKNLYSEEELLRFAKSCFYKGFDKAENDDANCYTAFREEISSLFEQFKKK